MQARGVDVLDLGQPVEAGEVVTLRFRAVINPNLVDGTTIVNEAQVGWNDPLQYESASVAIDVGGVLAVSDRRYRIAQRATATRSGAATTA